MTEPLPLSATVPRRAGRLPVAPHRLLGASLGVLHLGLLQGIDGPIGRTLMLAHLGLFLIWQPVVRGAHRMTARDMLGMCIAILLFLVTLAWGTLALWMMVLAGVIGGGAFGEFTRRARLPYQLAVAYLVSSLFVIVLPKVVPATIAEAQLLWWLSVTALPLLVLAIFLLPHGEASRERRRAMDFVSAMLLFFVLTVTTLGALVFMWLAHLPYLVAILTAMFAMAAVLLVMAWAWYPRVGGPQLGAQFARRILSAGMSFEEWLHGVATLSITGQGPEQFLALAAARMIELPGVRGGRWEIAEGDGEFGECEGVERVIAQEGLTMRIFLQRAPSPALLWHLNLMVRVLAEFCHEKRHARELEVLSYVRAVHETGARLTHDVKNLLQSLNALCAAATRPDVDAAALRGLIGRQLPVVTQRLAATLDKLRTPSAETQEMQPATQWWRDLCSRHAEFRARFSAATALDDVLVPAAVFHAAADNLVSNALDKQLVDRELRFSLRLDVDDQRQPWLEVTDSGEAVPAAQAAQLLKSPVASESGLGMGLYQVARQAEAVGFQLRLVENRPGCVRFRLDRQPQVRHAP